MSNIQNLLNQKGFNLIALPKTGIKPLDLLYKKGNGLGSVNSEISRLFTPNGKTIPSLNPSLRVVDIGDSVTVNYDAKGHFNVLEWLLSKLNLGKLSGTIEAGGADKAIVKYNNITEDNIGLIDLDEYLNLSTPNIENLKTYKEKLENDEIYVITAVLKSNDMEVTVQYNSNQKAGADVIVKGIVDASVSASHTSDNSFVVKYKSDAALSFAFQAQQIIYEKTSLLERLMNKGAKIGEFRIEDAGGLLLRSVENVRTKPLDLKGFMAEM